MKTKGNKIVIIVLVILIAIVAVIAVNMLLGLKEENALVKEVEKIEKYLKAEEIETEKIEILLKNDLTTGKRLKVEKAIEQYSLDLAIVLADTTEVLNDGRLTSILTTENFKTDGPNFIESKKYITETIEELEKNKKEIINLSEKETIMKYIENDNLNEYYTEFYLSLALGEGMDAADIEEFEEAIDSIISLVKTSDEILNLLINNPGTWQVSGDQVLFSNQEVLNKYQALTEKIKNNE